VAALHRRRWNMGEYPYGSIIEREVKLGEKLVIDNTHLVAMDDTLDYNIRKFGGLKTFFFGGKGFVFIVRGALSLLLQSRKPAIWYTRRS